MLVRVTAECSEFASEVLCLNTRCKHGIPAKQVFDKLMSVHKDTCPSHNTIFRWIREIQTGCFELQKGKSPGRPISTSNAANVQKVKGLIDENCRLSCYELESITELPKTTVHDILVSNLGLRNVCSVWVQHKLSESNKTARVLACT